MAKSFFGLGATDQCGVHDYRDCATRQGGVCDLSSAKDPCFTCFFMASQKNYFFKNLLSDATCLCDNFQNKNKKPLAGFFG
jgi:hypothetical protein